LGNVQDLLRTEEYHLAFLGESHPEREVLGVADIRLKVLSPYAPKQDQILGLI
jgi:hypothetical protein